MPDNNNVNFLIVGAGRGGTSLMAGLLDYHPKLEVGFELFSVAYLMGKELPYQGDGMFHQRATAFISACKQMAGNHPNSLWGNKITTEQLFGLEDHNAANPGQTINVLDTFFNDYLKNTKIIFILRDGRTCVNSKVRRTGQPMEMACKRWKYSVECYQFFSNHHANNLCVRFETLLHQPQAVLMEICQFLGVQYEQTMLDGVGNKKLSPEYIHEKIDTSKTKQIELPDEFFSMIEEDLKYCGYI
ncbi:MAG: sulfotransferase [Methylobacter sp.]|uniref:sulfotransferase family protein n=1 Tax=Methylovulum miyakonense TaxID=645578 RepID=UPI000382ECBB|nr:sulfotransferase [Methylovulum miyakonense]PPD49299.1 MAG: sulfotransferase [Methylobacter sp.]